MSKQHKEMRQSNQAPINLDTSTSRPIVTIDYELYAHYLEDTDLSEDEKREFLQTIWNIICEFVSLGFGVHPVQQAQFSCGKQEGITELADSEPTNNVKYSGDPLVKEFADAIGEKTEVLEETES